MNKPLKNKVFISTRPAGSSEELSRLLEKAGAKMLELPLVVIQATQLSTRSMEFLQNLEKFNWIIFTSPNGIRYFFNALSTIFKKTEIQDSLQFAVIGSKTEQILRQYGYQASFTNPGNTGEDFAEAFIEKLKKLRSRQNILLALGNLARNVIQKKINLFANCTRIDFYNTTPPSEIDKNIVQRINDDRYEMLIFTSPSGIQNFLELAEEIEPEKIRIACIGIVTADASRKAGVQPIVVANQASAKGIVQSIINYYN
jgi:uroporphyrinogen-III synthase